MTQDILLQPGRHGDEAAGAAAGIASRLDALPEGFRQLGEPDRWLEFRDAHCERLHRWFRPDGTAAPGPAANDPQLHPQGSSRVTVGQCVSLLDRATDADLALANNLLRRVDDEGGRNHFLPERAMRLLLSFPDKLEPDVAARLKQVVAEAIVGVLERRFGSHTINNFSCINTFILLGAAQVLDGYSFDHPHAGDPIMYTPRRLHEAGLNAVQSLACRAERDQLVDEFNSPTYTPISIANIAHIVNHIDDEQAKQLALRVEAKLWRETLAMFHSKLGLACGPYSRGRRQDVLGHVSHLRTMMCYLGLSRDESIVALLERDEPELFWPQGGSPLHHWHLPAVECSQVYHVPTDALSQFNPRRFPYRFEAPIEWAPHFELDHANERLIPTQGDYLPAGEGRAVQQQGESWCLAHRTQTGWGETYPIHLHYALRDPGEKLDMTAVRAVLAGVMCHGAPAEWARDMHGRPSDAGHLHHHGHVTVEEADTDTLHFHASALPEMAPIPADEVSLNTFISAHFGDAPSVTLNGEPFTGQSIEHEVQRGVCRVEDAGFVYEIAYQLDAPVRVRLWRWGRFIRFAALFAEGEAALYSEDELQSFRARGIFHLRKSAE